ncbi:MAG TPA: pitrilysin family protein [Candidatus Eisenbacteria bacterium]|jgi:zinc protease
MTETRVRTTLLRWTAALLLGGVLAPAATGSSQPRETVRAARNPASDVSVRTLRNGMRILVWPDHEIPNVALYTWYRVGTRNERPGITGISHFFEHMMFRGSERYPAGSFDRLMEASGGANNAYTTQDVTVYQDWFPRSALETIFQLEADRICCLVFDPGAVEAERGVVYSERRATVEDDNAAYLDEQVEATAFVTHPYRIPTIGWPADIEGWTLEDLRSYFRRYYAPNNATMLVVGDVTPAEVYRLAEKHLAPIPPQPSPPPVRTVEPPQPGERRILIRREAQVPLLQAVFHCGSADDPDAETLELLMTVLVSGESSRLYRRLVDTDRVAVDVGGYASDGFDPGLAQFFITVSPERGPAAAESSLVDELGRFVREGPSEAEVSKARNFKVANYWRALETIDGKAGALGYYEVFRGDYRKLFAAPQRYARVTRKQIRDLAGRIFVERNRTIGVLVPEAKGAAPTAPGGTPAAGKERSQ